MHGLIRNIVRRWAVRFMTNLGGFGNNTTLGVITGDIRGAVGVQILGITTANGTTTVTVQHHLVTEAGDTVFIDQAQAIGVFVTPDLFALRITTST